MTIRSTVLSAPSYFVLAALLDGPLHGYVIIKRVEALSDEAVRLAAGSLYAVLDRLAEAVASGFVYAQLFQVRPTVA